MLVKELTRTLAMSKQSEFIINLEEVYKEVTHDYWERVDGLCLERLSGLFTHAVTAWLMMWQKIIHENSLSGALQRIQKSIEAEETEGILEWVKNSKKVKFKQVSSSTSGLSQARSRLPLKMVTDLADRIYESIFKERKSKNLWCDKRVYLIDGTDVAFINTPKLIENFPPQKNPSGECFPIARVLVAHDLMNGLAVRPEIGTQYDSEQSLSIKMMPRLEQGSIVMGDMNFGVFSIAYHTRQNKLESVLRLQKKRAGKIVGHGNLEAEGEYAAVWTPSRNDLRTNPDIPKDAKVEGKVIVVVGNRNGFRPAKFYFFVSSGMTDISPQELLEFYYNRWLVEADIRSIKYAMHLETISIKDADMARKEIILGVCGYNLIRAVIARGVEFINLSPRDISFTRAVLLIKATAELLVIAKDRKEQLAIQERFLVKLKQIRHPKRKKHRTEPRLVVRKKKSFPPLRGSRKLLRDNLIKQLN